MDDFDRDSNASSDNEHDDDIMIHDADGDPDADADADADVDVDGEDENENDNQDHEEDDEEDDDDPDQPEPEHEHEHDDDEDAHDHRRPNGLSNPSVTRTSATPGPLATPKWKPKVRPEMLTAATYDIVPTMAAPMATSINAMAITPDLRYWMTGGSDGYIRKYDGPATINGKTLLTVAQRHPFVDSVTKAGVLMSYWENAEPQPPSVRQEDLVLSPVYSLAVHSQALWLLSGLESGGINLQSVRHDEGKRITCLKKHTNAVSVLTLSPDEKSVLSGSWDKNIFDWDLNTGQVARQFDGSGGQISAIEIRPMGGQPIPPEASEEEIISDTFFSNNAHPGADGDLKFEMDGGFGMDIDSGVNGMGVNGVSDQTANGRDVIPDSRGSPGHDSLFGGSPTGGSDLFSDNDGMGAFGGDEDNEFSRAMMQDSAQDAEVAMGDYNMSGTAFESGSGQVPATQPLPDSTSSDNALFGDSALGSFGTDANHDPSSLPSIPEFSQPINTNGNTFQSLPGDAPLPSAQGNQGVPPQSPSTVFAAPPPTHYDMTQTSDSTFLSASIDGTLRVWDRRMQNPVARIGNRPGVPPWCMGACWSPDGNWIYAGRRNGTVEEFSIQKAKGGRVGWQPERVFKFPGGSGPVSCVRSMVNGRHLVCASHDILRLYDLRSENSSKHSPPPFLIIPGPPRAGVISSLYIDPSSRFMISAAGNRGWEGTTTEVLIGYEINVPT
ncbi:WD40 repeat-like protein [Daldinia caldariorum]|uniref:WD40 repeat-like protein n=1 Tax=Daldinia caldariorum TaxID=326644 RepID=UPI00200741AE|nr:WD40 repeat-like protein [Daldinia caldariorum]KAI1472136.1 WD40 repeat-like protein [Daldinia caldariorum]